MERINAILIEDEPLARKSYEKMIKKTEEVNLLGVFENPVEAMDAVNTGEVDLIFSDIQMPEMDGISFVKALKHRPFVIFITGHPGFAAVGFDLDVLDYIVKPLTPQRLERAFEKAKKAIASKDGSGDGYIKIKDRNRTAFFTPDEIFYVESSGDYVSIFTAQGVISSAYTMKEMEELLPAKYFFRIQRSYIVNIKQIASVDATKVILKNEEKTKLPIGLYYRSAFYKRIGMRD